ncbi:P-type ATPase (P-ATPase) Superfamily Protein [Monocercomonoides exilis]|uniref:P-type ATPase (P-ATPase) Superfamily Protein n=1 Tax=Monocercomonoides exilis TaxID=2049356 RepID=UPI003559C777|nr:P-type ATPase (P-ATPase) Superfamily Protein [Monocercomonoides exilis]|eukprot:MONOS_3652.1-p1 / transcript=MONOS_3652.1 / gene=MONOS_3652 / organism=Monocercomonoides_exilis_PA203 / gene_product=P-type ATPase (P-ATPase) Superfamily Protein / transcript_product=P-type ATPase (P-ATPase) Superfamily Protein / location=Mono_scaffold00088:22872-27373(+) / protein_length=1350 / sequence_SO=supercontig / SO=protein_coding / is_pseudo=false
MSMSEWPDKHLLSEMLEMRENSIVESYGGLPGVMKALHTSSNGLDPDNLEKEKRFELYGKNEFARPKTKSFFRLWLEAFNDTTLIILLILATISLVIALVVEKGAELSWLDGTAIYATVIIVTFVSAWNTWSQERQFEKLNERQKDRLVLVTRGGEPTQISVFDIMVGDVVAVSTGDVLPVDGLCIESNNISCDEAPMTGESDLIRKTPDKHPFLLCGCKVQTGYGKMVTTAVGMDTQFGILKQAVLTSAKERSLTPLQEKLDALSKSIGVVGFIAAGFVLVLLLIFWLVPAIQETSKFSEGKYWILLLDYFTISVTIIVMAVPEGLPLAVTIALAYSMKRMLADNNLVRVLSACETMGGATTICSDKTGTLTQNKMKVTHCWFDGEMRSDVQKNRVDNWMDFNDNSRNADGSFSSSSSNNAASSSSSSSSSQSANIPSNRQSGPSKNGEEANLLDGGSSDRGAIEIELDPMQPANAVVHLSFHCQTPSPSAAANAADGSNNKLSLTPEFFSMVAEAISLNSSANIKVDRSSEGVDYLGNVTECALLLFCTEQGVNYTNVRKREKAVQTFPFSSERKRMTVILQKGNGYRVHTKGASEIVSALCTKMHRGGRVVEIGEAERTEINQQITTMASMGLRTIALAYRDIDANSPLLKEKKAALGSARLSRLNDPLLMRGVEQVEGSPKGTSTRAGIVQSAYESATGSEDDEKHHNETASTASNRDAALAAATTTKAAGGGYNSQSSHNLTEGTDGAADESLGPFGDNPPEAEMILLGITGIKDPLRREVPFAIQDCHDAHIVVRMVTGDNIVTAMHIAEECGIYDPQNGIAMEGPVFRALSDEDRKRVLPRLQVLARSSPIDKHTLVSGLQDLGHVVAVTGDGTNDAPALSKSDVGFAMGITGTEVAKDASSIIITDDNFASIVKAVMWGRNVYDSIRKFIQFQLTVNIAAIIIAVFGAIFAITPLRAVQMLWVNLIMDTLAALALATETPTKKLLKRKPYGKKDSIICKSMWRNIVSGAIYEMIMIVVGLFLWGDKYSDASNSVDTNWNVVRCPLLESHDVVECSHVMFPHSLCRHFLLDPRVAVFSEEHFSFIFNTFIWMQMFNWIASRKCYNEVNFFDRIFSNIMFIVIWVIVAVLQALIMVVPGLRDAFTVIPITPQLWGFTFAFSLLILPMKFIVHLVIKMPEPFNGEVEIAVDEGVPAGVYQLTQPPPRGCTLTLPDSMKRASSSSSLIAAESLQILIDAPPPPPPTLHSGTGSGEDVIWEQAASSQKQDSFAAHGASGKDSMGMIKSGSFTEIVEEGDGENEGNEKRWRVLKHVMGVSGRMSRKALPFVGKQTSVVNELFLPPKH